MSGVEGGSEVGNLKVPPLALLILASYPGARGGGESAWYTLFAHTLNYFTV